MWHPLPLGHNGGSEGNVTAYDGYVHESAIPVSLNGAGCWDYGYNTTRNVQEMTREEQLSRKLTYVLRHRALKEGLELADDGYVRLADIMQLAIFANGAFSVQEIVSLASGNDNKMRFGITRRENELWIRANQGHSIRKVRNEKLLTMITNAEDIPCCVHGTYLPAWEQIVRSGGLSRMSRNHIHFATRLPMPGEVCSGVRSDCHIAIFVDVASAMADGLRFYRSANGVILTAGDVHGMVPSRHFASVEQLSISSLWPMAWAFEEAIEEAFQEPDCDKSDLQQSGQLWSSSSPNSSTDDEEIVLACPNIIPGA
mmetsp:Transcript_4468/g.10369  ORF Transcript_4468/g.10369 Transcript_4468/m.10369 type:complete len:313 (-) Transcript_4468:160-1098(-)